MKNKKLKIFTSLILVCLITFGIGMYFSKSNGKELKVTTKDTQSAKIGDIKLLRDPDATRTINGTRCALSGTYQGKLVYVTNCYKDSSNVEKCSITKVNNSAVTGVAIPSSSLGSSTNGICSQKCWKCTAPGVTYYGWSSTQPGGFSSCTETTKSYYQCKNEEETKAFNVVFNANGGNISGNSIQYKGCTSTSCSIDMPTPSRSGYKFNGWSTSTACTSTVPAVRGQVFTKATTYYACWTQTGTAGGTTFSSNGCYTCGSSVKYYKQGSTIPSECSKSIATGYSSYSETNGWFCSAYGWRYYAGKETFEGTKCGTRVFVQYCKSDHTCSFYLPNKTNVLSSYIASGTNFTTTVIPNWCETTGTGTATPAVAQQPVQAATPTTMDTINDYRYAQANATYSTSSVSVNCGDKLYITKCVPFTGSNASSAYCEVSKINGAPVDGVKVKRQSLATTSTAGTCGDIVRYTRNDYTYSDAGLTNKTGDLPCGSKVIFKVSPGDACSDTSCQVTYNGTEVYVPRGIFYGSEAVAKNNCTEKKECKQSEEQKDVKSSADVTLCLTRKSKTEKFTVDGTTAEDAAKSLVKCAANYTQNPPVQKDSDCDAAFDDGKFECTAVYTVECKQGIMPSLASAGSVVGTDGLGKLDIEAYDNGSGVKGYNVSNGDAPTSDDSNWTAFTTQPTSTTYTATVSGLSAGTYYAWAISKSGNISFPVMSKIVSTDVTTTASSLGTKDAFTGEEIPTTSADGGTTGYKEQVVESGYVRLANTFKNDSVLASFDPFTTGYTITVNTNKVAVYATLTSTDSAYVEGYEPRTVDLKYGRNVILIKIRNNKGHVRVYTIIANRVDDRSSDNTLKNVTVSKGTINFDSNVTDYTIEVPKNATEVSINGTLNSQLSAFVNGYEPRKVTLKNDVTSAILKIVSPTGSVRGYVLTFVKSGADETENNTNSTYLSSISVPGSQLLFERNTFNYTVSVDYAVESLPIYAFAESSKAKVTIEGNEQYRVGNNTITITVTNGSKSRIYTVTVIRKEDGLGVSSDTTLKMLKVQGYNLKFDANKLDYVLKIKREKTLVIVATPNSDRSNIYMYGNNDLTGFSTVRIKVIAEDGTTAIYSLDIRKDAYNKTLEITAAIVGAVVVIGAVIIISIKRKKKRLKDYIGE